MSLGRSRTSMATVLALSAFLLIACESPVSEVTSESVVTDSRIPPSGYTFSGVRFSTAAWQDTPWQNGGINAYRFRSAAVFVGGKVYITGGARRDEPSPETMAVYDTISQTWDEVAMPRAASLHASVVLDGKVIVIGGFDASAASTAVNSYDPGTGNWTPLPSLPDARTGLVAGVVGNTIVATGGRDSGGIARDTTWYLESGASQWTAGTEAPKTLVGASSVVLDGTWYIIGGMESSLSMPIHDVYAYDLENDMWGIAGEIPGKRIYPGAVALDDDLIYLVGGEWAGVPSDDCLIFDPATGDWWNGPDLSLPRSGLPVASDGTTIYAAGGRVAELIHGSGSAYFQWEFLASFEAYTPAALWLHLKS